MRHRLARIAWSALALAVVTASSAVAQDRVGPPNPPADREAMWRPPTADDWAKPVLLTFQRTWDDALAVQQETNQAILICINMDGEIASEHYAGVRYRAPDIAKLYEPYVCVIASVYRHNTRDYDDQGRRVLCPRFGSVTCGEHITIEPILYEKYMEGERVAPRHIMIELDGKETYDVYYANDTASVFKAIDDGIQTRTTKPTPIVRGDRPIVDRVASREISDRKAVESAYRNGDTATKRSILEAALANQQASPIELLRMAVFGFDADLSGMARKALTASDSPDATDLIVEALRVPMNPAERDALIAALERIGVKSRRAQWLSAVHKGLSGGKSPVDPEGWSKALQKTDAAAPVSYERHALQQIMQTRAQEAKARKDDPAARIALAEVALELAVKSAPRGTDNPKTARTFQKLLFHDARQAALEAERLGSTDWRVSAVLARAAYFDGDVAEAYTRAEKAVAGIPEGEQGWNAATVLTIFAESRFKAIKGAIKEKKKWEPQWLTDLHASYTVLLQHPLGTVEQAIWYYDFLAYLRARHKAAAYLDASMRRFPASAVLHNRLRRRHLRRAGPAGMEAAYAKLLADTPGSPDMPWYAGYASMVGADFHRRVGKFDAAIESYNRSIELFDQAIARNPGNRPGCDHYIALVLAGRARLHYQKDNLNAALGDVIASFQRAPDAAGTRDGVGVTPGETAQVLMALLTERKQTEAAATLQAEMDKLDPELLRFDRP